VPEIRVDSHSVRAEQVEDFLYVIDRVVISQPVGQELIAIRQ